MRNAQLVPARGSSVSLLPVWITANLIIVSDQPMGGHNNVGVTNEQPRVLTSLHTRQESGCILHDGAELLRSLGIMRY